MRRWLLPLTLGLCFDAGCARPAPPARADHQPAATPETERRFAAAEQRLASQDAADRASAADEIVHAPSDALPLVLAVINRPLAPKVDLLRGLALAIWGQVPNWLAADPMWIQRPEPTWVPPTKAEVAELRRTGQKVPRRPPPHDADQTDWIAGLSQLALDDAAVAAAGFTELLPGSVDEREQARAVALGVVAALHRLGAVQRLDVAAPIFELAFRYDGVFRDECGRQLRALGSWSIPLLVTRMHDKTRPNKQRRYASYQLDRMDRARPQKAIATAPDDRVRAEIIHAYGEARAPDAVEAILDELDAPARRVRREARAAWQAYVAGKEPPPAPKRKRKLPGGREEETEKPDYLTYREIATLALHKRLAELEHPAGHGATLPAGRLESELNGATLPAGRLESELNGATAAQMTTQLLALYDARHASEWDTQLAQAAAREAAGDLGGATAAYTLILAHDPGYARKDRMAPAFAELGEQLLERGDRPGARHALAQAMLLAPGTTAAQKAEARVVYLDALTGLDRGLVEPARFRAALALDPALSAAARELAAAELRLERRRQVTIAAALVSLLILTLLGRGLWRRATTIR